MVRVKLLANTKYGKKDQVIVIDNNEAFGLIDSGKAILTKDMTSDDYSQAGVTNVQIRQNPRPKKQHKA